MDKFANINPSLFAEYKIIAEWELNSHKVEDGWHVLEMTKVSSPNYTTDNRYQPNGYCSTHTIYTGQTEIIKILIGRTIAGKAIYA